jgi:NAD(P)-dependent dehydrogenase (short-subunit alcohol dehydrogenase family)
VSTAPLADAREIKAALIADMRRQGQAPRPSEVETVYRQLLRDRETRRRLEAIRATGARVEYRQVDLADEGACADLVEGIYRTHGRLDGVIHGAGVIEDKLVVAKSPCSFDRVFDTKVTGALVLARVLEPASLAFLAFFSSVTARWGNRGQADYAAANELLNKLAVQLGGRWPGRVVALNWGPWAGSGMVSEAVARQFAERGVELVSPHAGVRSCLAELTGVRGDGEVVLGGGPWLRLPLPAPAPIAEDGCAPAPIMGNGAGGPPRVAGRPDGGRAAMPLLDGLVTRLGSGATLEITATFDPERALYLHHHRLDGKPVVPAAVAAEFMAEAVQQGWPEWVVTGLSVFRVLHGIVLGDGPKDVRLVARPQTHAPGERLEMQIDVELFEPGRAKPSYRATVDLAPRLPESPPVAPLDVLLRPFPLTQARLYREWLFHGPSLQCIVALPGIAEGCLVGELRPSRPAECLAAANDGCWLLDPVLLDGGLQLALLYMRATWGVSALPAGFAAVRRYAPIGTGLVTSRLRVRPGSSAHAARFDVLFVAGNGQLILAIEGLEATGSRALNRLMGWREPGFSIAPAGDPEPGTATVLCNNPVRE